MTIIYIAIGAGVGAPTRYLIDRYFRSTTSFPWGILIVNVLGSFLFGVVNHSSANTMALLGVGFSGALTTWSAFALDLEHEYAMGLNKEFLLNIFLNYGLGFLAVVIGMQVGR